MQWWGCPEGEEDSVRGGVEGREEAGRRPHRAGLVIKKDTVPRFRLLRFAGQAGLTLRLLRCSTPTHPPT